MSQPKRRSRKTKLVPRSTEGGEPELKEVIEEEIKIMNTMSLAQPQASQRQASKKSESLQFKVDIEVEEWIDDEMFIEENFAKMQSEKLSEALEKEIKEEVDWTNDEYGKLWAEAASDSETEEKALNEYEKLIKNQFDPSLLAGPSKVTEPEPKKAKTDEKSSKQKNKKDTTPQQTPKPSWKVKKYVRSGKKSRMNQPIKQVSDVNLQPRLKINIVFDEPAPENPVINQIDQSRTEERHSPAKMINKPPVTYVNPKSDTRQSNIKVNNPNHVNPKADTPQSNIKVMNPNHLNSKSDTPQSYIKVNNPNPVNPKADTPQSNIKVMNPHPVNPESNTPLKKSPNQSIKANNPNQLRPIYIVPAKTDTPKQVNKDDEPKKSTEDTEENPSTSEMIEDVDKLLQRPIYFIEVNKSAEKINRAQLRHMAYKSILKQKAKVEVVDLEHIIVNEDDILTAADAISKIDDRVAHILNIQLRNRLGCTRFETMEISREDALVDYAFRQWFVYQGGLNKSRSVPLLYKCYICNDGWWHLEPFRNHIKKHSYVAVVLEKHNQECNIIAHDGRPVKYRMFPIDNECWRCGKSYAFHSELELGSYKCIACSTKLYTCLALKEHMGICLSVWKNQMEVQATKDIKAYKCKICPQIFFNEDELHKHQYMFHVPRSDYPIIVSVRQCSYCNQNYIVYMFHYCRMKLVQKHVCKNCVRHFPSGIALNMHMKLTKLHVECEFCHEVVPRECCMMEHLLKHTDKFMLVYKCLMCPNNVLLEDYVMVQRHVAYIHKSMKLAWCCSKMIIPRSLYKDNKCKIDCKPSNSLARKKRNSLLKPLITGGGNKSEDTNSKETSKDSNREELSDVSPKSDESNHDTTVLDIPVTDEPMDTDTKPTIKIENLMDDYYEEDSTNINNLDNMDNSDNKDNSDNMDNSYNMDNSDNMYTEIDIKPPIMPTIKIEPQDTEEIEVNITDEMEFDEVPVKQEKTDDYEAETSGISKNSSENKEFSAQIQNFLENMDVEQYEIMNQRGNDLKDNIYVCINCDYQGTRRQYKKHIKECKSADTEEKFVERECTKCQKTFKSMKDYAVHLRVHGFITCHCKECDMQFANLSAWSNHINSHINQTFTRVKLLSNDMRVYMCKICKEIVHRSLFFKHWEVHIHEESCLEVRCDSDGNISNTMLRIIIDIFQANVKRKVPKNCVVCGRVFMRMNEKKRHLVEHLLEAASEERSNTESLQCQICRAGFDKPDQFRRHMRDHAGLPVYHCELCDKTFSDSSNFVKHKKVHNMEAYICDVCNKKFLAKTSLVAHIATHCPEPIRCRRCPDRLFYSESVYRRHVRIFHDRVTHFTCNMCKKRFQSVREKWDHQWEVHRMRNQIVDCQECSEKFRKVSDLRKHLAEVHSVKHINV